MTAEHFWSASDGARLFYRYDDFADPWRDAPTVVLLHPGMGSSLRLFGWVPHLAREYRVVRPDIRGHGRSESGPVYGLSHDRLAADLIELLDHLGVRQAHVMGSSAGGMIAGQAALRRPERFRSLAMYAATAGIPPSRPQKGDWFAKVLKGGVRGFLEETVRARIGNATPEQVCWYLVSGLGGRPDGGVPLALRAADDQRGLHRAAGRVHVPGPARRARPGSDGGAQRVRAHAPAPPLLHFCDFSGRRSRYDGGNP